MTIDREMFETVPVAQVQAVLLATINVVTGDHDEDVWQAVHDFALGGCARERWQQLVAEAVRYNRMVRTQL